MPFIGVRISWLMLARKALLATLAASAASLARQLHRALANQVFEMFAVEFKFDFRLHAFGHIPIDPLEAGQLARSIENGRCIRLLPRSLVYVCRPLASMAQTQSAEFSAKPR
jgi:hypothetical protein